MHGQGATEGFEQREASELWVRKRHLEPGAPEECTGMGRGRHQRQGVLRRRGLKTARGRGFQKRREPRGGKSSVMNLTFVSLPNSCVEGLMPRVAVFGFGTYKEVIKVKWGNKDEAPIQQD